MFQMEPALNPNTIAALHAPDAGNVIPYEFAIALAENAVNNGVELRIRREVTGITKKEKGFELDVRHWEPKDYVDTREGMGKSADGSEAIDGGGSNSLLRIISRMGIAISSGVVMIKGIIMMMDANASNDIRLQSAGATLVVLAVSATLLFGSSPGGGTKKRKGKPPAMKDLVEKCSSPAGSGKQGNVEVTDMFTGGSGSWNAVRGVTVGSKIVILINGKRNKRLVCKF